MAIVLLTLCLAGQPCEQIRVPVRVGMIECVIHGQQIAAWWQQRNPIYGAHQLRGWRCEIGERV